MLIEVPILLDERTEIDGISASTTEDVAVINTDYILIFHRNADAGETVCLFRGGVQIIILMPVNNFMEMLDNYEIKIYDN